MPFDAKRSELTELLSRLCDGEIEPAERERLETLLLDDAAAQDLYRRFIALDVELAWRGAGRPAPSQFDAPVAAPLPAIIEASPALPAPASTLYPFGSFVFSYAAAVVIVGIGLLIGWAYQVSTPRPDWRESVHLAPQPRPADLRPEPKPVFVGRVTDMVECRWADPKRGTVNYAYVPLGGKYALASGLMEITYDSGAKVILQGPCTYRVDSRAGGYLSQGRLTARVGERGERREEREEGGGHEKVAVNQHSTNQHSTLGNHQDSSRAFPLPSPLSSLPSPLFTVRTPTAKVADLGTEFGVEVDPSGMSTAHVYEGKVELLAVGGNADGADAIRLEKDESARVEVGKDRVARVVRQSGQPGTFVRQMPKRVRIKAFNTGVNLKEGKPDPHWQLVARSDDPKFKPRPAVVVNTSNTPYLFNQADRSQWISAVSDLSPLPNGVFYTFRTTFDLKGMRASTAVLHGRFVVDNHVRAIRLSGREIPVPKHDYEEFGFFHGFSSDRGFVEGINVLEVDVENGKPGLDVSRTPSSPMGLLVELDVSAMSAWPEPSAKTPGTKQKLKELKN
ncbi:MAG: hypothetical protein WCB27_21680 [Thermoguttaceae bacterium]|jgi:hypothetical protein